jgi:transcriptional regulator with XRE-family HTH domain
MVLSSELTPFLERATMTKNGGWPASGFGQRLRQKREAAGLSQLGLANKAACRSETISRLERGEQEPAWPLVIALARALGIEVGAFVVEEKPAGAGTVAVKKSTRKRGIK